MNRIVLGLAGLMLAAGSAVAQERKDIFADPQNLKVLPEDISSQELSRTMRGIAMGLGARCETCHVGEAGEPLETFDFAADEKENKEVAREMLRMVAVINREHVGLLEGSRIEVACVTCHRGVMRPLTTSQVLREEIEKHDTGAAVTKYRELREEYYGTHSYDFSESVLSELAQGMGRTDPESAMALLRLNDEFFPDSFQNHWLKGEVAMIAKNNDQARENFEKALEIGGSPRSEAFVKQRLDSLPAAN